MPYKRRKPRIKMVKQLQQPSVSQETMINKDITHVSKLADAGLYIVTNPDQLSGEALQLAIEKYKLQCDLTVSHIGISEEVQYMRETFSLSNELLTLMCFVLLPAIDSKYIDFYKKLSGGKQNLPTLDAITSLITSSYNAKSELLSELESGSPLFTWGLIRLEKSDEFALSTTSAGKELADYFSDTQTDPPDDLLTICTGSPLNLPADAGIQAISSQMQIIRGGFEERRLTVAIRLSKNYYNQPLYRLNSEIVKAAANPEAALRKAFAYVLMHEGIIYWQNGLRDFEQYPAYTAVINDWLKPKKNVLFVGETDTCDLPATINPFLVGTIQLVPLTRQMEKDIWVSMGISLLGKNDVNWELINNSYTMNMKRIGQTILRQKQNPADGAPPDTKALQNCYVSTSPNQLTGLAIQDTNNSSFDKMVLPPAVKTQIDEIRKAFLSRVFLNNDVPTGTIAIFEGPPGTGKTMAAESLADALKLPLYRLDYSQLDLSTESRLQLLFEEAYQNSAALLFDEADVLFSKKKDPDGPGALITAFLIQKVENYAGLVILTTNAKQKIDPAFMRRAEVVTFPPFTQKQRYNLFVKLVAQKGVKIDSEKNLLAQMSTLPLSGRNVINIINNSILSARSGDTPLEEVEIAAEDFVKAIQKEKK
jgi:hypothetical protein